MTRSAIRRAKSTFHVRLSAFRGQNNKSAGREDIITLGYQFLCTRISLHQRIFNKGYL